MMELTLKKLTFSGKVAEVEEKETGIVYKFLFRKNEKGEIILASYIIHDGGRGVCPFCKSVINFNKQFSPCDFFEKEANKEFLQAILKEGIKNHKDRLKLISEGFIL